MTKENTIKLFESRKVRVHWDAKIEKWYFSVIDIIEILTESKNSRRYWSDLKIKLKLEGSQLYEKIVQLKMKASDGNDAWKKLLYARAMENQCYVAAVNRVGNDGKQISHSGDSMIIDYAGRDMVVAKPFAEEIITCTLNLSLLNDAKDKFPAWKDADEFTIKL